MVSIDHIINHVRHRPYMSGVEREKLRVKATGEVFTPTNVVNLMLDKLDTKIFTDKEKTIIDNCCGDGQFLSEVLIRKCQNGIDFETALSTIYGVDIMEDNVHLCRERLLCGQEHLRHIVKRNIVWNDATTYDYSFNGNNKSKDENHKDFLFGPA